ncbi:hypothetical protein ILYODFUR_026438 [Ilyodon furcidens]|uniref:Uncharacterized protein n=1 Tax=Ilyodon furcidens TaxID=33524 RepID=A0ABV0T1G9_9TELE
MKKTETKQPQIITYVYKIHQQAQSSGGRPGGRPEQAQSSGGRPGGRPKQAQSSGGQQDLQHRVLGGRRRRHGDQRLRHGGQQRCRDHGGRQREPAGWSGGRPSSVEDSRSGGRRRIQRDPRSRASSLDPGRDRRVLDLDSDLDSGGNLWELDRVSGCGVSGLESGMSSMSTPQRKPRRCSGPGRGGSPPQHNLAKHEYKN